MKQFVYLASCLTYYHETKQWYKALEWRLKIIPFLRDNNIKYFDPVETFEREINHSYDSKICVAQNKSYLDKTTILIVNLNDILKSPGSLWEISYASLVRKIPVIGFGEEKIWSPHIKNGLSIQLETVEDVMELISNMFLQ